MNKILITGVAGFLGSHLAESCLKIVHDGGYESLRRFLEEVDQNYEQMVQARRPEELLLE